MPRTLALPLTALAVAKAKDTDHAPACPRDKGLSPDLAWRTDQPTDRPSDRPIDRQTVQPTGRPIACDGQPDRPTDRANTRPTNRPADRLIDCMYAIRCRTHSSLPRIVALSERSPRIPAWPSLASNMLDMTLIRHDWAASPHRVCAAGGASPEGDSQHRSGFFPYTKQILQYITSFLITGTFFDTWQVWSHGAGPPLRANHIIHIKGRVPP